MYESNIHYFLMWHFIDFLGSFYSFIIQTNLRNIIIYGRVDPKLYLSLYQAESEKKTVAIMVLNADQK